MTTELSREQRRACLDSLKATRLRELLAAVGAEVRGRSKSEHVEALVDAEASFDDLVAALTVAELRQAVKALGLEVTSRSKADLVAAVLGAGAVQERVAKTSSVPPFTDARASGTLKSALRRFVLDAAGGYRGKDAELKFTLGLLQCFGWPEGRAPGAEIPADVAVIDHAERTTRRVAAVWNERRALIEVTQAEVMLDFAWKDVLKVCLQLDPVPQYVVLTNQRDLHLYDLARDKEKPRLAIPVDDLPKYSEAFPFLSTHWVPGTVPKIINVGKVSREVADLVARVYRSLYNAHPKQQKEVIQFILQCIVAMFAEDIGLLPQEHFTSLLYEGAKKRDVEARLRELFRLMSTKDAGPSRAVAYFNGGLFKTPVTLPLNDAELAALTKAAEANWRYVDPHIFGSVFQGIMNDAERHASGAHYTAHDDIMRVVGPTIVEPWRKRIREAKTLSELLLVRDDLFKFKVLDPACGSGNFLYIAFRELYRLDTELLARLREFPSTQTAASKTRIAWSLGIKTSNFYGIDINPFAVELAKVTLNIAKKIAFDERKESASEASAQVEMDVDPSLPLDNLDENIVCEDALFCEWPKVDAMIGNPPILGGLKIRGELGVPYLRRLQAEFPGVNGRADYCSLWFRRAQDRLALGGRAGLVATNSVREGPTKAASTDYIVSTGGTITNAVSSKEWPGEASLFVSIVNWTKGPVEGPRTLIIDGIVHDVSSISSHLQLHADSRGANDVGANTAALNTAGVQWGTKSFQITIETASQLAADRRSLRHLRPIVTGTQLLNGQLSTTPDYVIEMNDCDTLDQARTGGSAFDFLKQRVLPEVKQKAGTFEGWIDKWWQHWRPRRDFFAQLRGKHRLIACSRHAARSIFAFLSLRFVPNDSMQLFALDDDYSFGLIQSALHWQWATTMGTKLEERIRYTNGVWTTFPWPQDPTEASVARVGLAAQNLRAVRRELMEANGWSLRALHQAAEVEGAHPLKDAQQALDEAVAEAYGMPADQDALEFLLELNKAVAEDEAQGLKVMGPGLPPGFYPKDPRWSSSDCIEPPPLPK